MMANTKQTQITELSKLNTIKEMNDEIEADESTFDYVQESTNSFDNVLKCINKTFEERIKDIQIELRGYMKHDAYKNGIITGHALLMNKAVDLTVIDIDINKSYTDEQKDVIRKNIIKRLSHDDIIVKTASGGLHIYVNTAWFHVEENRAIKCYQCTDFDVDLFHSVNEDKRSLVVLPGSKVRKDHRSKINQYEFIQGSFESKIKRTVDEVLNDLDIKLKVKQTAEIEKIIDDNKDYAIDDELAERIVNGLNGFEVHNDGANRPITEEITLFTLFQAINSLPDKYINEAYESVRNNCKLTLNAQTNFDNAINRYSSLATSPFVLIKIIRIWNAAYYNEYIKPLMNAFEIVMQKIDLNDEFTLNDMHKKAEDKEYTTKKQVVEDMSRCFRYIDDGKDMFVIKILNTDYETQQFAFVNDGYITKHLKRIRLWKEGSEWFTAYQLLIENWSKFAVKALKFNSNKDNVLSMFHGYAHNTLDSVDMNKIQMFLDFVKEVIANNNEEIYQFVLNWIAYIIQNPGKKTEIALILKGLQGIGKNRFTDALCELLAGYSTKNITDISELTGTFNSVVEGRMLLILNEMKNCGDERMANFNALKSVITDNTIRINEKLQPRRDAENVANFIFCTNNAFPVKIEAGDRRYCVLQVNGKYKEDFDYFKTLCDGFDAEFYDNLLTFFIKRDLTNFNVRKLPMTEAKQDLIDASKSPFDMFICDFYNELCDGMPCADALMKKPREMKDRAFQLQMKDKCIRKQKQYNGSRQWFYILKDECKKVYKQTVCDDEITIDDADEIPI